MLHSLLKSKFSILCLSLASLVILQKLLTRKNALNRKRAPLFHLPYEDYKRSHSIKAPLSFALSAFSLSYLLQSLAQIMKIYSILKTDFNNPRQIGEGVYQGVISSNQPSFVSSSEDQEKLLITGCLQIQKNNLNMYSKELNNLLKSTKTKPFSLYEFEKRHSYHFYMIPKSIILENHDQKIILSSESLIGKDSQWPAVYKKISVIKPNNELEIQSQSREIQTSLWKAFWEFLRPVAQVQVELCEKGLQLGASIFVYGIGKTSVQGKYLEIQNHQFISSSLEIMKNFIQKKLNKTLLLAFGSAALLAFSARYFFKNLPRNEFTLALGKAKRKVVDFKMKISVPSGDKDQDEENKIEKIVQCDCKKYIRNVLCLPCGHLASCYHCMISKNIQTCAFCFDKVEDYFVMLV